MLYVLNSFLKSLLLFLSQTSTQVYKDLVSIASVGEGVIWIGLCDSSSLTFLSNLFYSTNDNSLHCQCSSCLFSANSVLVDHLTLNFSDSSGLSFVVSLTMHECHDLVIFLLVYVKAIRNAWLWSKSYTRRSSITAMAMPIYNLKGLHVSVSRLLKQCSFLQLTVEDSDKTRESSDPYCNVTA